ncbi:MAG: hypothetical protein P0S96_01050 [Simkaniaceae bacterium]|nr:hypothetical protein [Candidatus Sacchlamyda saccharinae]
MSKKHHVWSQGQIILASYLSGLIGGCYLLGRNYKKLGQPAAARKSYILGILGTILLSTLLFFLPEELFSRIPNSIIPMFCSSIIIAFASYQKKPIKELLTNGEKRHSYWWCLLISIALLLIQTFLYLLFLWTLIKN